MTHIAAIDAGASEIKVSVFDASGREVASAARDCPSDSPSAGWAQCSPDVLMQWPMEVLKEAVVQSEVAASDIAAIGVTGSRATILPVGHDGQAVGPVIFWYDRRGQHAVDQITNQLGSDEFFRRTGVPLDPTPSITKILWLRDEQPQIYSATSLFALPQTVVLNTLTGSGWFCDDSYGSYYGFMDLKTRSWDDSLLGFAGISEENLPQLVAPGTVVGSLGQSAAAATGLAPETKVVAAGSDASCCKLGAGVEGTGIASIYIGTAGVVGVIAERPVFDNRLTCCPSALPGCWDADGLLLTAGSAYRWLREMLSSVPGASGALSFKDLDAMAAQVSPGSEGVVVVPHFAGAGTPLWNSDASGNIVGLRLSHGAAHLARAVLEGVVFALRHALDALGEHVVPINSLQLTGGGGGSELWSQILADATGIPVSVPSSQQSTSLGAAMMAGVAAGVYSNHSEAINAMSNIERSFEPDPSNRAVYETAYGCYLHAVRQMEQVTHG